MTLAAPQSILGNVIFFKLPSPSQSYVASKMDHKTWNTVSMRAIYISLESQKCDTIGQDMGHDINNAYNS